ncbi:hypothetical protein K0M31_016858, partial [Melipona bicolor]
MEQKLTALPDTTQCLVACGGETVDTFPRDGTRATYDCSDSASPRITGTETGNPTPDPINGILEDGRGGAARGSAKRTNE